MFDIYNRSADAGGLNVINLFERVNKSVLFECFCFLYMMLFNTIGSVHRLIRLAELNSAPFQTW